MTAVRVVPSRGSSSGVKVTATGPITHRCPFADEIDSGAVDVEWITGNNTFELHSLRDYLGGFADTRISHEDLTTQIFHTLNGAGGIRVIRVATRWTTAGMDVEVLREPVNTEHP